MDKFIKKYPYMLSIQYHSTNEIIETIFLAKSFSSAYDFALMKEKSYREINPVFANDQTYPMSNSYEDAKESCVVFKTPDIGSYYIAFVNKTDIEHIKHYWNFSNKCECSGSYNIYYYSFEKEWDDVVSIHKKTAIIAYNAMKKAYVDIHNNSIDELVFSELIVVLKNVFKYFFGTTNDFSSNDELLENIEKKKIEKIENHEIVNTSSQFAEIFIYCK